MKTLLFLLATALLLSLPAPAQENEARTALIVGVETYSDRYFTALGAPVADARSLKAKLESLGFHADLLLNPTRRQLTEAVDAFGSTLARRGGIGLFYFSGHGAMKSDESGTNYLIPGATNIRTENDLPEEAFNAQRVANRMKEAKNRLNLVFLDACRNHTLPRGDGAKSGGGGLSAMRGASGLMFFFATQPGEVAIEDASKRSLFTTALLKHMDSPGLSFMDMMGDVTAETEEASLKLSEKTLRQSPFISGTFSGRFYFKPTGITPSKPAIDPVATASKDAPFVNSLGMEFVPAGTPGVYFCRWETRVRDFAAYVESTGKEPGKPMYSLGKDKDTDGTFWKDRGHTWRNPGFPQDDLHPVVGVNWEEAQAFCAWLSKKEGRTYRLARDSEWSRAAGNTKYPWGDEFPPKSRDGNYASVEAQDDAWPANFGIITGLKDGFGRTAPAGSYRANTWGLFDMGGNVWEWCEDEYKASMNSAEARKANPALEKEKASDGTHYRVLRGGSWSNNSEVILRSSFRDYVRPSNRIVDYGFRCVLVVSGG